MVDFKIKDKYNVEDFRKIMALLRAPGGCPWDREQTIKSLRATLLEEAYEVAEAIDEEDPSMLCEELGDLLLQVVFHSRIEQEMGGFDFDDVCNDICQKLIIRHPHVFADVQADTPEEVLRNWSAIKEQTKGRKTATESMVSVPKGMPALIRAGKVQKKAAAVGFDWSEAEGALDKLAEETEEFRAALASGDQSAIDDEFGDLLFSAVNVSRFANVNAETALAHACDKFIARFSVCESLAAERGIDMKNSTLEQLDALWDEAKIILSKK